MVRNVYILLYIHGCMTLKLLEIQRVLIATFLDSDLYVGQLFWVKE